MKYGRGITVVIIFLSTAYSGTFGFLGGAVQYSVQQGGHISAEVTLTVPNGTLFSETPPVQRLLFAIRPDQRVRLSGQIEERAMLKPEQIRSAPVYSQSDDSSMIVTQPGNLGLQKSNAIEPVVQYTIEGYQWYRGYYLVTVAIQPLQFDRITSSYQYATKIHLDLSLEIHRSPQPFRPRPKRDPYFEKSLKEMIVNYDAANPYDIGTTLKTRWFVPSQPYAKLVIGADDIYRLAGPAIVALFPGSTLTDLSKLQLWNKGEQIPLFVHQAVAGTVGEGDYIEFPALRNYTGNHRIITTGNTEYNEYLDRYSDSTYLWLTIGTDSGIGMPENPPSVPTVDTLSTYTDFRHLEENSFIQFIGNDLLLQQNPQYTSQDMWGWTFIAANGNLTGNFSATDIADGSDSGHLYVKIGSWGAAYAQFPHKLGLRLNGGADIGQDSLNRYQEAVLTASFSPSALSGGANAVSIYSYPTASTSVNWVIPDWIEIEYPRQLAAIGDSLEILFTAPDTRDLRTVRISGISTTDVALYKVSPSTVRIANIALSGTGPFSVSFVDSVGPNDRYLLLSSAKAKVPVTSPAKIMADLFDNGQQADFLVVTHTKFLPEAENYAQYIGTSRTLSTRVVNITDIYDEYGYGYPTPMALQEFLESTTAWTAPMPAYLFLIGDASYDYKFYEQHPSAVNYVPSFGYPVSDALLTTWADLSQYPQIFTGRLPVNSVGETSQYLDRIKAYESAPNSEWNKKYLFFSGGDPASGTQIAKLKSYNDFILNSYVVPPPIGGVAEHFYKTTDPPTDFGPFPAQDVRDAIQEGGVFISYIGHSGTQTWDNSIVDPLQLKNTTGRYSFVSDFGCSTGKFAEPDIKSFSELFTVGSSSSAIGYIGNSSLGYESIAASLPKEFYGNILRDTMLVLGQAHLTAKIALAQANFSGVNALQLYTNTLIGDPAVRLAVPFQPNLALDPSSIHFDNVVSDDLDSTQVRIVISNNGSVNPDSVDIAILHTYLGAVVDSTVLRRPMPAYRDTMTVSAHVLHRPGEHLVTVSIDPANEVSELMETDNAVERSFVVASTNFRALFPTSMNAGQAGKFVFLNPDAAGDTTTLVDCDIDTSGAFIAPIHLVTFMDTATTTFDVSSLPSGRRYWWRVRKHDGSGEWTIGSAYRGSDSISALGQADSIGFSGNGFGTTGIVRDDVGHSAVSLVNTPLSIRAISAGATAGNFGVVEVNGINVLPNSFTIGHSLIVMDTVVYSIVENRRFDPYNHPDDSDSLAAFLANVPDGMMVISVIIDDGSNNLSTAARDAYQLIGATKAGQLEFRGSYAVIGWKGAAPGTALEEIQPNGPEKALVETTVVRTETSGSMTTGIIGPAGIWQDLTISAAIPPGAVLRTTVLGIGTSSVDTVVSTTGTSLPLDTLDAVQYPFLKLLFSWQADASHRSPLLYSWKAGYLPPAELVVPLNAISIAPQVVQEGEPVTMSAAVRNVGFSDAKNVLVTLSTGGAVQEQRLLSEVIPILAPGATRTVSVMYDSRGERGDHTLIVRADSGGMVSEVYTINNTVTVPFSIAADTLRPSIDVTIDGQRIVSGDFIPAAPAFSIIFHDNNPTVMTQADSDRFAVRLDNHPVHFSVPGGLEFAGSTAGSTEIVWKPELSDGEHVVSISARDISGNASDTVTLSANVARTLAVRDVYNLPNPFSASTVFTFTVTGPSQPDKAVIKVFTVTGRLIHEITTTGTIGFNRVEWNGRDRDGDEIGNGVYLYKVIVSLGGERSEGLSKFVRMR